MIFHISAGAFGLLSGAAALFSQKGSDLHRAAGKIFVLSMLTLIASATVLEYWKPEGSNILGTIFPFYVVATAWMTVKRKAGEIGRFEWGALVVVLAIGAGNVISGLEAANSETGLKYGFTAGFHYFWAGVAAFFAAGDARLIYRRGISGAQRIARHLWRMCFALLSAAGAFFLGQAQVFPDSIRDTQIFSVPINFAPVIIIAVLLFFWLFRVLFTNLHKTD